MKSTGPFDAERRRLVLVEDGGIILVPEEEGFDQTLVVAQLPGEPIIEFADRVLHRIAGSERAGKKLAQTVLCVCPVVEGSHLAARRLIALGVAAHAASTQAPGELLVSAPATATAEERDRLLDLADELLLTDEHYPLTVRFRFAESPAETERADPPAPEPEGTPDSTRQVA